MCPALAATSASREQVRDRLPNRPGDRKEAHMSDDTTKAEKDDVNKAEKDDLKNDA